MVVTSSQALTLQEFLALPETKPAREYLDGRVLQKPMPQGKHSTLQLDLAMAINEVLKLQKIARSYTHLGCTFGDRSLVPDVSVFTWGRIPRQD